MREEYEIKTLNPRKNPYISNDKKQITINLNEEVINYFKNQADLYGIPYQRLINLYLIDCVDKEKKPHIEWK